MQMYDRELRTVEGMAQQSEQTLESTSDHVDELSRSLRKIIAEASSALGEVESESVRPRSKSQTSSAPCRRKSLPSKSPRRSSQKKRPSISCIKTVCGHESGKGEPLTPQGRRVSFGEEEPENEPADDEDAPLLPPPPVVHASSLSKEHTQGWKCPLKAPIFGDMAGDDSSKTTGTKLQVPDSFSSFCSELLTIRWDKSSTADYFLKTE